ncbi:hypothetical protein DTO271G3_7244 [Paecilomyces variotii]|nr:hypothetical protein DTO271G3_7244 [Paecilomyces variotii]
MRIPLLSDASDVFEQGTQYAAEDGKALAYGTKDVTAAMVQETCNQATESYAKVILNWPIPVKVELGQTVDGLRMGDETEEDVFDRCACYIPEKMTEYVPQPTDHWAFVAFSTLLASTLPLLALVDSSTDEAQPSEATLQLVSDSETNRFQMSQETMKEFSRLSVEKMDADAGGGTGPEAKGILVMQMERDGNTEKDDNVLKNVGKTTNVHQKRVEVKEALEKARGTAESAERC